jgi:hypothetical protein
VNKWKQKLPRDSEVIPEEDLKDPKWEEELEAVEEDEAYKQIRVILSN